MISSLSSSASSSKGEIVKIKSYQFDIEHNKIINDNIGGELFKGYDENVQNFIK